MTPSVALTVNPAPVSSAPASDAGNASSSAADSKFHAPLQQARQQFAHQGESPRHASAKASSTSGSSSQAKSDNKGDHKDDGATSAAQGATAAMLALLGQSVPASAAASNVSADADTDDATDAVTGAGISAIATTPAAATISLLGAMQGAAQGKTGDADEFTKAMDGVKDKSLSMLGLGADDGDDSEAATATDAGTTAKGDALAGAFQALTASSTSNQKDGSDPLEALKNLTAAAMQPQTQPNATATTPAPHVLTMQSSVGTPAFGQELSQQVTWLGGQDVKEARIRLHPEDLGELDVKVSVKQDHVDVAFIAQHPQAVHAVQQTLTQLDSMLAHHGLTLGQAQVGQGHSGQGSSAQSGRSSGSSAGGESGLAEGVGEVVSAVTPIGKVMGLVDMFA